jgi:hypothetical protein
MRYEFHPLKTAMTGALQACLFPALPRTAHTS